MSVVGIICEYNPLHLGHLKQINAIREAYGPECSIVCLMSGNFVQRGAPAIADKSLRSQAAVLCGADLVLELPVTAALNSAEGFAAQGVRLLSRCCDTLCFGTERGEKQTLRDTAAALLAPEFSQLLKAQLDTGLSFPAARQAALTRLLPENELLRLPNDILAVEYCKAILDQKAAMDIFPIVRRGSYHDPVPDSREPSATALRALMLRQENWDAYIPEITRPLLASAPVHTLEAGERAILARLRTMTDGEFEALPFGSEGLWRKLMHESRRQARLEDIITAVKSKRYTRTRIQRMVMCAFLGLTGEDLAAPAPYARVLAFSHRGREILAGHKKECPFPNLGEKLDHPFQALESRADALYPLFRTDSPGPPEAPSRRRVVYIR